MNKGIQDKPESTTEALIKKAYSRSSLGREEQRRLGLLLKDSLEQNKYQANIIREMKDEILKLKLFRLKIEGNKV